MSLETEELFLDRISHAGGQALTPLEKEVLQLVQSKQRMLEAHSHAALEELFAHNSTSPVKIRNVQFSNAQDFRDPFLRHQVRPLLTDAPLSLADFLGLVQALYQNLVKLDILDQCVVSVHSVADPPRGVFAPPPMQPLSLKDRLKASRQGPLQLVPVFSFLPQKRFYAKTGTNIGNGEGDGYIQFQLKNLFGGAETLAFDAITGTKTPSSYLMNLSLPIANDARFLWHSLVFTHTRNLDWLQGSVDTKGMSHQVTTRLGGAWNFDVAFESAWRRLSNHGSRSLEVMLHLKDSLKSSVLLNIKYDSRDHHVTPSRGLLFRLGLEKSGLFRLNNVAYSKVLCEAQAAVSSLNHSVIWSQKAGLLFNLRPGCTNILDRFYAGGPNDVRAFSLQGLGPKSCNSSVGGDFFMNGGVSLISHIPYTPRDTGFKFHNFLNFGKVVSGGASLADTFHMFKGGYSIGCGFGILYNHPQTRFELNFVLPLAAHSGDSVRKGFQCGVGISFL